MRPAGRGYRGRMTELGLFPLGIALLPSELLPLHIFEDRYKELIGECLADERGIRPRVSPTTTVSATSGRVRACRRCSRSFEDGRLNILAEGGERFRLDGLTDGRAFQTGLVRPSSTRTILPATPRSTEALRLFERLRELTGSEVDVPEPARRNSRMLSREGRALVGDEARASERALRAATDRARPGSSRGRRAHRTAHPACC